MHLTPNGRMGYKSHHASASIDHPNVPNLIEHQINSIQRQPAYSELVHHEEQNLDGDLLHEMVHKSLQRHVIRKNGLGSLRHSTVAPSGVGCRRVQFRQQETSLGTTSITDDEPR
jgi:hypothetical protein